MRKPLIAANWKMNKLPNEADAWIRELFADLSTSPAEGADLVICAPFTHLPILRPLLDGSEVRLGAQDVSANDMGAYTGEVSADMLKDLGVHYVIIGHSERRAYHQETDAVVNSKITQALRHGLTPIFCLGESLEEREAGDTERVVLRQLEAGLKGVGLERADSLVIAYEPIWAIGTGRTASAADAQAVCHALREKLQALYPQLASDARILYGGSMKPDNAAELLAQEDIDGGLIGGASLSVASLLGIARAA
jgi:triosephosphate isomerase (TIM)